MNTIALFGGTGRTGLPFMKHGLSDFKIKALVRNPDKVGFTHQHLELITGDITRGQDIRKTIEGTDVVVSLIGHNKQSSAGFQTEAIRKMIQVMEENQIRRLVSLTGAGVNTAGDQPQMMDKLIVFIMRYLAGKMARNALLDGKNHARLITESDLNWTLVRGPMLTEEAAKGHIEVGHVGKIPGFKLTREDLALFIIKAVKNNTYIKEMPFVTNGK